MIITGHNTDILKYVLRTGQVNVNLFNETNSNTINLAFQSKLPEVIELLVSANYNSRGQDNPCTQIKNIAKQYNASSDLNAVIQQRDAAKKQFSDAIKSFSASNEETKNQALQEIGNLAQKIYNNIFIAIEALKNGNLEIIASLIEQQNINFDSMFFLGRNARATFYDLINRHANAAEIKQYLAKHNMLQEFDKFIALRDLIKAKTITLEQLQANLTNVNVNMSDSSGTLLSNAIDTANNPIIEHLLHHGARVDDSYKPLARYIKNVAPELADQKIIFFFLDKGADLFDRNNHDELIKYLANDPSLLKILLQKEMDIHHINNL